MASTGITNHESRITNQAPRITNQAPFSLWLMPSGYPTDLAAENAKIAKRTVRGIAVPAGGVHPARGGEGGSRP